MNEAGLENVTPTVYIKYESDKRKQKVRCLTSLRKWMKEEVSQSDRSYKKKILLKQERVEIDNHSKPEGTL